VSEEESIESEEAVVSKFDKTDPEPIKLLALEPSEIDSVDSFQEQFDKLASALMNDYILDVNGRPHRLAELEFYLKDDNHPDTFTHCDELQLTHAKWYFHKVGKGYKGGSYKGLDITFATRGHGGILIRALIDLDKNAYIEGPSTCVDHILTLNRTKVGIPEIVTLVDMENFNLEVDVPGLLHLRPTTQLEKATPVQSGRVGLVLRTDAGVQFGLKPYRYMIDPSKVRKGRQHLILELYKNNKTADEIQKLTGATKASIQKYLASYDKSKKDPKEASAYFAQKLNADQFCEFYYVLREAADPKTEK
jgi:hypothetical protein